MENTSTSEWPTDPSCYKLIGRIGKGAFAKVFMAKCTSKNDAVVAIKVIKLEDISVNLEDIRKEVLTLKLCNNENILSCYCCFVVGCTLWIVTPLMIEGSFLRILQYRRRNHDIKDGEGFSEKIVAYIIRETAKGLKYLHDSNILHRDVKAGNILVDAEGNVRLADLGVSRVVNREKASTFVGTPCWMAPEVMEKKPYDGRADVWSLGITALELFKGYPPYAKSGAMDVFIKVQNLPTGFNSYQDDSPIKPSSAFQAWISAVLKKDVESRYTIDKALAHRWLAQADEGKEELKELLETIPELKGEEDQYITDIEIERNNNNNNRSEESFVKGTTWDFGNYDLTSLQPKQSEEAAPSEEVKESEKEQGKEEWLQNFENASVPEQEAS